MVRKILLSAASLFLILQSYNLLSSIHHLEKDSLILAFFLAFLINLFITGIFAFAGFAFPTQKLLSDAYYEIKYPKRLKRFCKKMNIELFRKMLLATFWRSQNQRKKHFNGKKDGIPNLILQSKKSEFGHLIPFLLINVISIYLCFINLWILSGFVLLINIMGNLYPIILQRHHRMRIQILQRRYASRR